MESFDIESLLRFSPPGCYCQKCYALYVEPPVDWQNGYAVCEVCGTTYVPTDAYPLWRTSQYFAQYGLTIRFNDTIAQSRTLAAIAMRVRNGVGNPHRTSPMDGLLQALGAAQQFIHFTTFGMSLQLVGALRMAALNIPVRGIVANASPPIVEELKTYAHESSHLETHLYERSDKRLDWDNMPHQKVIIIDGLLAFKGSANLTVDGWRKAAKGLDSVDVVTDVNEVIALNNRLFSPIWARDSAAEPVLMTDDVPF